MLAHLEMMVIRRFSIVLLVSALVACQSADAPIPHGTEENAQEDEGGARRADVTVVTDTDSDGGPDIGTSAGHGDTDTGDSATEWRDVVEPDEQSPDLMPAETSLFIPQAVDAARAVLVFHAHEKGTLEYEAAEWRASAGANGYAIMKISLCTDEDIASWQYLDQSAHLLLKALFEMAMLSGHPEIAHAPLVLWGHSSASYLFSPLVSPLSERTAGFIAFKGMSRVERGEYLYRDRFLQPSTLAVPGLAVLGAHDSDSNTETVPEIVADGRALGALWSLVFEPGGIHNDVGTTHSITIPFVEAVLERRVPQGADAADGPVELNELSERDGRLGWIEHHRIWVEDKRFGYEIIDSVDIAPVSEAQNNIETSYWLISEAFAELWQRYQLTPVEPAESVRPNE